MFLVKRNKKIDGFAELRECGTCGHPADDGVSLCEVCAGDVFLTRYWCQGCGTRCERPRCEQCTKPQPRPTTPLGSVTDRYLGKLPRARAKGEWVGIPLGAMAGLLLALVFEIYANDGDPMAPGSATLIGCVVGFLGGLAVISNTRDMTALIVTAPLWVLSPASAGCSPNWGWSSASCRCSCPPARWRGGWGSGCWYAGTGRDEVFARPTARRQRRTC